MQVMQVIAEILKREGISTLFCFPTTPIIEAAAAVGIKPVICRQERVGVHMADGFARVANGRPPGVFAMQYGPGAENAFAGVATAFSELDAGCLPAARPSARDGATVPDVQIEPHLCLDHQIGRGSAIAARDRQHHAARLFPGEKRAVGAGHGGGAGRCDRHRGRYRPEHASPGSRHPVRRRRARHRRRRKNAARRLLSDDPRGSGRLLCRSDRGTAPAGRTAAGAGHDHLRRQERLSRGPCIGARAGRRHLYRTRPPFPAQIRPGAGRRVQLYPPRHRHPGIPVRQEVHPRDQRHPRPAQGLRRRSRHPRRRQARPPPIDRGGARSAGRQGSRERRRSGSRGQARGMARPLAGESCIRTSTRSTPTG